MSACGRLFVSALLGGALLLSFTACSSVPVQTLETRPSGEYAQVLTFKATAARRGPSHALRVGVDIDPAQLMGWTIPNRAYTLGLNLKLEGPAPSEPMYATLLLPVIEQQEVSRDDSTGVVQVAYVTAGKPMQNGFRRGEFREPFRFSPTPGEWTLTVEMRTANNANRKLVEAVRTLRIEVLGPKNGKGALSTWAFVPSP